MPSMVTVTTYTVSGFSAYCGTDSEEVVFRPAGAVDMLMYEMESECKSDLGG